MHYDDNTVYYEGTLMSYVKQWKNRSFSEAPFNEVDALLLCQMMNLRLEWFVPQFNIEITKTETRQSLSETNTISWKDMDSPEKRNLLYGESVYGPMYSDLFDEIKDSSRYGQIRFGWMRNLTDHKKVVQERILRVFSYDGMGFRSSFYKTEGYSRISEKIYKLVPAESLIGMLFVPEHGYKIVESYEHGFLQHDLMNWRVEDGRFVLRERFTRKQNRIINRLNRWILSLSGSERKRFVDLLFYYLGDLLESDGAQAMTENKSLKKIVRKMISGMPKDEKRLFIMSIRRFIIPRKARHV